MANFNARNRDYSNNKKRRYDDEDNGRDMGKKAYSNNGNNNRRPRPDPEPVEYTNYQAFMSDLLFTQMVDFVQAQANLESLTVEERIHAENELFSQESGYHAEWSDDTDRYDTYVIDRSLRMDRETHRLNRAAVSIVALDNGIPAYMTTAYLTAQKTGNISVIPLTENGPQYRRALRKNITAECFQ